MLQTYINGVPYIMASDFKISDMVGNKSLTDITVRVDNQAIPRAGDIVEIKDIYQRADIDISTSGYSVRINSNLKWGTGGKCWIKSIPQAARYVVIRANADRSSQIAFLTSSAHSSGTDPAYCSGTSRISIPAGTEETFQIPADAQYLYIDRSYSTTSDYTPQTAQWAEGLDSVIFWGILGIPRSPKYTTGLEWRVYKMTAGNGNSLLACRVINEAFRNYTISQIVTALYNNYIAAEGIELGGIATVSIPIKIYSAADFNLQDALNELAELCGGAWTISAEKKFYFSIYEEFPAFPVVIDKTSLRISEFQHSTKAYKQRTVQYISGATNTTIPQTETFIYDSGAGEGFNVSFGVNERPTIKINGSAVDPSKIGVAGLDYNDPSIWFTFAYNSKTISYNTSSEALSEGDAVEITYIGIYSIRISAENTEKIAEIAELTGTSGRREIVTSLSGVRSQDDAVAAANSLLEKFADATEEITFWMRSQDLYAQGLSLADTNVMTKVTINIPEWGADGDYIIAERHLSALDGDLAFDAEKKLIVSLRLVNRDYMKSYGEILADLRKNVRTLTIRDDEVIVKAHSYTEAETLGESIIVYTMYPNFPVAAASSSDIWAMPDFTGTQYPV